MKMINLRVDTPVIRGRYEANVINMSDLVAAIISGNMSLVNVTDFVAEVRITGITFRSADKFGDSPVTAFSRKLFGMFRSNVMEAHIKTDGHSLSLWSLFTVTKAATGSDAGEGYIFGSKFSYFLDADGNISSVSVQPDMVLAKSDVQSVLSYELKF